MNFRVDKILSLDLRLRSAIRFLIELTVVFGLYLTWLNSFEFQNNFPIIVHYINFFAWCILYQLLGLSKDRIRYSSLKSYLPLIYISSLSCFILSLEYFVFSGSIDIPRALFMFLLMSNSLLSIRIFARQFIRHYTQENKLNVLVYGTSDVAIDLVNAMSFSKRYKVHAFIADKPITPKKLAGLKVIQLNGVKKTADSKNCSLVILASNESHQEGHTNVLHKLEKMGLSYSYAPTMDKALDYEVQLKAVKPEEVLGRETSIDFDKTIESEILGKNVFVTGGGGSIGSELCRQLLRYSPANLIILEANEYALYNLEQELNKKISDAKLSTEILYYLGSITDEELLSNIFQCHDLNFVYHAAAYKHVPLVESNVISAVKNNIFGTRLLTYFSNLHKIEKFVLISTDKAVRPTNVMGATKRLAELIVQTFGKSSKTKFAIVRFGNVLGSSGSVIPKFKSQITSGGPVTVTHPEITRYFMSIPEAAHLVLHAGRLSDSGAVFLLDMGDPVKILDLAKSMIRQHGLQPVMEPLEQQTHRSDNKIQIKFSGLRPGEKLYEELLIDNVSEKTKHHKIFKSSEPSIETDILDGALSDLELLASEHNVEKILDLLKELPLGFTHKINSENIRKSERPEIAHETSMEHSTPHPQDGYDAYYSKHETNVLTRLVSTKIVSALLHKYFLLIRGMTLGVRVIVQNPANEILLVQHTYLSGWHLPGGGVDYGEAILDAARREVYEETGIYDLKFLEPQKLYFNSKVSGRDHIVIFNAQTKMQLKFRKNIEVSNARFFAPDQLPDDIDPSALEFMAYAHVQNENS